MSLEKETFKEMKTLKNNSKMNEDISEYIAEEKSKSEVINGMMSSTDYVKWLIQFTQDKDGFYDDNYDYSDEKLGDSDKKWLINYHYFLNV